MTSAITSSKLSEYINRVTSGGVSEAVNVYSELYDNGYSYAGWAQGVATGSTITGTAALDYLKNSSIAGVGGVGGVGAQHLTSGQIDNIRIDMALGYLRQLQAIADTGGGSINRDVNFSETEAFHAAAFMESGLGINNWTLHIPMEIIRMTKGEAEVERVWESLRNTGGDRLDASLASLTLSNIVGRAAFSPDPTVRAMAQEWMERVPGVANLDQIDRSIDILVRIAPTIFSPNDPIHGLDWLGDGLPSERDAKLVSEISRSIADTINIILQSPSVAAARVNEFRDLNSIIDIPANVKNKIVIRTLELTRNNWLNGAGAFANKTWDSIQRTVQGLFGGAFDNFDLLEDLLAKFQDSTKIVSPVVLDLDGNGFVTSGTIEGVQFDHDTNGYAERTGWIQGRDGILVLDKNSDGKIDSGRELFGSETLLKDGSKAANGYEALKELDENHDGRIDVNDSAYTSLRVWIDDRADGLDSANELHTLAEVGVSSIGTAYVETSVLDSHGNTTKQTGTFVKADGSVAQTADIWFATDEARTQASNEIPETAAVATLPDLQGFGNVPSLHQAMLRDGSGQLQSLVQQYAAATDVPTRRELLDQILYRWAGVDNVDPASRGGYMSDARQLYVLEAFSGQSYVQGYGYNAGTSNTGWNAGAYLSGLYREFADAINARLMAQTHLASILNAIKYNFNVATGTFEPNVGEALDVARTIYSSGGLNATGLSELGDVLRLNGANGVQVLATLRTEAASEQGGFGAWLATVGNVSLVGGDDNDLIIGTEASEQLVGNGGNDTIDGAAGNDLMLGDAGNDVYLFSRGGGQDSILDLEGETDVVRFGAGIASSDLTYERKDYEVIIHVSGTSDTLTLRNWGAGISYRVERFEFADGTVWGATQIQSRLVNTPIIGGAADDILSAWVGEDTILRGMGGNDNLWGFTGNDSLDGGNGDDLLRGNDGVDTLLGGDGNDSLLGDGGADRIDGGSGADLLFGDTGDDQLIGGDGNDQLSGGSGSNTLEGGLGNDMYVVDSAQDVIIEAVDGGQDTVLSSLNFTLADQVERLELQGSGALAGTGNASANYVLGNGGANVLSGLGGDDSLFGNGGNDVIHGGDGNDTISGDNGTNLGTILQGDDTLYGNSGSDLIIGGGGQDLLLGGDGDDTLFGDVDIVGELQGADTLDGGAGNDILQGGHGADTYIFRTGSGNDTIFDQDTSTQIIDKILLEGLSQKDVLFEREAGTYNLVIRILETNETLTIANHFYTGGNSATEFAIESLTLGDGTTLDSQQIAQISLNIVNGSSNNEALVGSTLPDYLLGQEGNDTLQGGIGNDVLSGGSGNDVLYGGAGGVNGGGDDTFLFGRGSGQDSVIESQTDADQDRIQLIGLSVREVSFVAQGNDLIMSVEGTNDSLRVVNYFAASARTIETIRFADGSSLDKTAVTQRIVSNFVGTSGNNNIIGSSLNDRIDGMEGNDTLNGSAGNDVLVGGAGNDYLTGGAGEDTYVFRLGDGRDNIVDSTAIGFMGSANDQIIFGAGIAPADVQLLARSDLPAGDSNYLTYGTGSEDLVVRIRNTADQLLISGYLSEANRIERFTFENGVAFNTSDILDAIKKTAGSINADALRGSAGADNIAGLAGDDVIYGFDGNDIIDGGADNDSIRGGEGADTVIGGSGRDTLIGGVGDDLIEGGDDSDSLSGEDGNDVLISSGDDILLSGDAGNDILDSGIGGKSTARAYFSGGLGNDRYVLRAGMGQITIADEEVPGSPSVDIIEFADRNLADFQITQSVSNTSIVLKSKSNPADVLEIQQLWHSGDTPSGAPEPNRVFDFIRFADGSQYTADQIVAMSAAVATLGERRASNLSDDIAGGSGGDKIYGYVGDDTLRGGDGDDFLYGMQGSDVLEGGAGSDVLDGAGFGISSGDGGNTLIGGLGSDQNIGGFGNDVFIFGRGDGSDTIEGTTGGTDTLRFGAGILSGHVQLFRDGSDLVAVIDGGNTQSRIRSFYGSSNRPVEWMVFENGEVWNVAQMEARASTGTVNAMNGTAGNDVFVVDHALDTITEAAASGTDEVQSSVTYALPENVENFTATGVLGLTIRGNSLDNILKGNGGDNEFRISGGNDRFIGGRGDDVYYIEFNPAGQQTNITVEEGVDEGYDTMRQVGGSWASFSSPSWYMVTLPQNVERLVLGTSSSWLVNGLGEINPRIGIGNVLDNEIYGDPNLENRLDGMGGRDLMVGGNKNDVFYVDREDDITVDYYINEAGRKNSDARSFSTSETLFSTGDLVISSTMRYTLGENIENLLAGYDGFGNALDNVIVGSNAYNHLDGGAGNDRIFDDQLQSAFGNPAPVNYYAYVNDWIVGGGGNDQIVALNGDDLLEGGTGNDTLSARGGRSTLVGGLGDDNMNGSGLGTIYRYEVGDGNDVIDGGVQFSSDGRDRLIFGVGIGAQDISLGRVGAGDVDLKLTISGTGSVTIKNFFGLTDTVYRGQALASIEFTDGQSWTRSFVDRYFGLPTDPEGTDGDDVLAGNASKNIIYGHAGNDQISGGGADDELYGGAGNDLLAGEDGDDRLDGGAGADTLDGGLGIDILIGGLGNDLYREMDVIIEDVDGGNDTVESVVTSTLADNIENLTLTGTSAINGTGNTLDNVLTGNSANNSLTGAAGNDTLDGGTGNDTMLGGAGNDLYFVDVSTDVVTEAVSAGTDTVRSAVTLTLATNVEDLILIGAATLNGTGNTLANTLTGNAAANALNGGTGADTMAGGAGNDTYTVDNIGDVINEATNEGTDAVSSSVTYTLGSNVENLTLTGTGLFSGTGNTLANVLTGNSGANTLTGLEGDDTLNGGTGNDTMRGGAGNDVYVVNIATDVVTELTGEGTDTVQSAVTLTLSTNVENLLLTGTGLISGAGNTQANVLTGNSSANTLTGLEGDDTLDGGSGNDTMRGGAGNDVYFVNVATDVVTEVANEGTDTVQSTVTLTLGSNVENLVLTGTGLTNGTGNTLANALTGNSGNNTLTGLAGNDTLNGGAGTDILIGGTGADTYQFGAGSGVDTVQENDSTASVIDGVSLSGSLTQASLQFSKVGNNLEMLIAGGSDKMIFKDWYLGSAFHVERFSFSNGSVLTDTQAQGLVGAMAAFAAPAAASTSLDSTITSSTTMRIGIAVSGLL